jgi:hypothetical protein
MIADAGALPFLVGLLWRQGSSSNHRIANGVVRQAADAITNLAHENAHIKTRVRYKTFLDFLFRHMNLHIYFCRHVYHWKSHADALIAGLKEVSHHWWHFCNQLTARSNGQQLVHCGHWLSRMRLTKIRFGYNFGLVGHGVWLCNSP